MNAYFGLLVIFAFLFGIPLTIWAVMMVLRRVFDWERVEMGRDARTQLKYGDVYAEQADKRKVARPKNTPAAPSPNSPPSSLSTRLAQLDEALRAGLITQQDYDKKRADIIASI
jgi:hypothetical protein